MASGFLFLLRRSLSARVYGIRPWAYAMLLGWGSSALRWTDSTIPFFFSQSLSDALLLLAMALMLLGLRRFNGEAIRMTPIWAAGVVAVLAIVWFSVVDDAFHMRIAVTCLYGLLVFPLSARAAFGGRPVANSPARALIGWAFVGISLVMLLQLIEVLAIGRHLASLSTNSWPNLIFVGSFNVLVVGLFFGFVMLVNDRLREELAQLANTDALTGILNRRAFMDEGSRVLARERRGHRPSALLMLDLDRFKLVNDTYGHIRGDRVLKEFAARVRDRLRAGDVLGRYGGEEFVVLLPGADGANARMLAEQLRARVAEAPFDLGERTIDLTVSLGVAIDAGEGGVHELIEAADWALYRAKDLGRNRVGVFGE